MSYYMGDFYRGDPGIGSFFGGLIKKAVGFIPGVGPIASALMPGGAKTAGSAMVKAGKETIVRAVAKHPVLSAAGAAGAMAGAGAVAERMIGGGGGQCRPGGQGRVLKKCGQVLKSGKCGKCHRRMNPFNPHAARRSARRLHSLVRHYRKYIGFVSAKRPKGRPYVKSRRRK